MNALGPVTSYSRSHARVTPGIGTATQFISRPDSQS